MAQNGGKRKVTDIASKGKYEPNAVIAPSRASNEWS
jgi:hypothetical protein